MSAQPTRAAGASEALRGVSSLDCGAAQARHASGGAAFSKGKPADAWARAERDAGIVRLARAGGLSQPELARVFGVSQPTVCKVLKSAGVACATEARSMAAEAREARQGHFLELYEAGYSLDEIGTRESISKIRVYEILRGHPDFLSRKRGNIRFSPDAEVPTWVPSEWHDAYRRLAAAKRRRGCRVLHAQAQAAGGASLMPRSSALRLPSMRPPQPAIEFANASADALGSGGAQVRFRDPIRPPAFALDFDVPPTRVLLAARNAQALALTNPDALVIDAVPQRIWRGPDRVEFANNRRWSQIFTVSLIVTAALGHEIHRDEVVDALWGDDPDGGPLDTDDAIATLLHQIRPYLRWAGLSIRCTRFFKRIAVAGTERALVGHPSFIIGSHGISPCGVSV